MYTVPWIINNMILDPKEMTKSRRPSELELKAQKSLQQLNVPDWYANKCIASPKIIVDRRPFESRPAPWKDPIRNRQSSNNLRKNEKTNNAVVERVAENDKEIGYSGIEKFHEVMKASRSKSPLSTSRTFPKMSPSRKIQNINIVFPTTVKSSETPVKSKNDKITQGKNSLDKSSASIDSLEKFTPQKTSTLENESMTVTTSTPIKTSAVRALTFNKTPRMNCPPPAVPTVSSSISNQERFELHDKTFSSPKKFPMTERILVPTTNYDPRSTGLSTPLKNVRVTEINCSALPVPSKPEKTSVQDRSSFFEKSSFDENIFLTPKKSTEMENIIKNKQRRSFGKSFVEEIIQELNSKCSPKVKSNYVSPTSKNFVKKLVRALEMGHIPKRDDEDNISGSSCSDVECKSESSSASISMKDSDSGSGSDCEIKSSGSHTSRESTFCSFAKALEGRGKVSRESIVPYVDDEDESVYWIPLPTCKLPRTSSLKNLMSRLSCSSLNSVVSTNSLNNQPSSLGWGKTFDRRQPRSKQLFRIDETTVIDSGYSDRSGTNSSSSSVVDESWYGDSETTQTASEIGEDSENGYPSRPHTRSSSHRILNHRQRTFVV